MSDARQEQAAASKRLLIVAHDPSPNTQRMVEAVLNGACNEEIDDVEAIHKRPLEAGPQDVLACNAIILGTTENLGYMSGALKDFFDRSYYNMGDDTEGLPYALYVRAGMDGTGTRRAVESICTGLQWRPVQDPLICRGKWDDGFLEQCEELGLYMAAGLDAGIL